jgi:DNA-binding IclR family transcriptional regulator
MIQVIERAFNILEELKAEAPLSLAEISEKTGVHKTTLCNILKTLIKLKYIRKTKHSEYALDAKLFELAQNSATEEKLLKIGRKSIRKLAELTGEGAMGLMLKNNDIYRFAKANCDFNEIIEDSEALKVEPYKMASSWTLISGLNENELERFIEKHGLPKNELWGKITTPKEMADTLSKTRKEGMGFLRAKRDVIETQALAAPVYGPDGTVMASLGLYLPANRFKGAYKRKLINTLKAIALETEKELSKI